MPVDVGQLTPRPGKAIVEITRRGTDLETRGQLLIFHGSDNQSYQVELDWEIATVLALGAGDWEPVTVGDQIMIQAPSGGMAGTDIGATVGRRRGQVVVVTAEEIVGRVG